MIHKSGKDYAKEKGMDVGTPLPQDVSFNPAAGDFVVESPFKRSGLERIQDFSDYFTMSDYCDLLARDVENLREMVHKNKHHIDSDAFTKMLAGAVFDIVRKLNSMCDTVSVDINVALEDNIGAYE